MNRLFPRAPQYGIVLEAMPHRIDISSTLRSRIPVKLLRNACLAALKYVGARSATIDVAVVGSARMRSLNKAHLKHDYVTDVLSFDLGAMPDGSRCGQLVICEPFAKSQARSAGCSRDEELARYVVHGTLHLFGYDDTSESARKKMWKAQEAVVRKAMRSTTSARR